VCRHPEAILKITLDLSKLLEEGKLTPEEAGRLKAQAARDTGSLAINILVGFGVVAVGARAGYWHATYALAIYEPAVTIVLFSALALATYFVSKRLPAEYEHLALVAARTAVFMVNFGFWIGSLWGNNLRLIRSLTHDDPSILTVGAGPDIISPLAFSIGWAIALLGVAVWGMRANRRWAVNVAAVFGAIHLYTQWFDRLGPEPLSFIVGGLLMLVFAYGLWALNRHFTGRVVNTA
jgi:hypothetical protein